MKYPPVFLCCLSIMSLAACQDNNKQSVTPQQTTYSISGSVLDDPLQNAKVCTDCNQNKVCDDTEAHTLSDERGRFVLKELPTQTKSCPLLAEVTTDSINALNKKPVEQPFTLTAPAGCYHITPITTMLQHEMSLGYTKKDATKLVQQRLMTDAPLCSNYISTRLSDNSSEQEKIEAKYLHQLANTFSELMASNLSQLENVLEDDSQHSERHDYVVAHQMKAMSAMIKEITEQNYPDLTQSTTEEGTQGVSLTHFSVKSMQHAFPLTISSATLSGNKAVVADDMKVLALRRQAQDADTFRQFASSTASQLGVVSYHDTLSPNEAKLDYVDGRNQAERNITPNVEFKLNRWQSQGFTEIENPEINKVIISKNGHVNVGKNYSVLPTEGLDALIQSKDAFDYAYFVNAKQYKVGGVKVSGLLNSHHDLQLWPQITDATGLETLPNNDAMTAFEVTKTFAFDFLELTCQENETVEEDCGALSVLTPNTSSGSAGLSSFSYTLTDNVSSTNAIVGTYQFNIPSAPIIHSDNNHYIIAWLFSTSFFQPVKRVRYFRVDKARLNFFFEPGEGIYHSGGRTGSPVQYLGSGQWSRSKRYGFDLLNISLPQSVQRLSPTLTANMSFLTYKNRARVVTSRKRGEIFEQKVLGVGVETHLEILESINHDKLRQIVESRK